MTITHELCRACEQFPCQCQRRHTATDYLVQTCSTPGCFTAIRSLASRAPSVPVCKWCDQGISHALLGKPATDIRLRVKVRQA